MYLEGNTKQSIIIIPAYKPVGILKDVVKTLYEQDFQIIVVDDGSGEEYRPIFDFVAQYALILRHDVNKGKGMALKTAYKYILTNMDSFEAVITADADGQHKIEDIIKLHEAIMVDDRFVIGSRKFTGRVPLRSRFGNNITRMVFAKASHIKVSDTQTGLRAFKMDLLKDMINIEGERYEYEMNVLLWASANDINIKEKTIETVYDCDDNPSHFRVIKDSARIYSSVIKFTIASLSSFAIDFILLLIFDKIFGVLGEGESLIISIVLARVISSLYNYLVNKNVVFKSKDGIVRTAIKYYGLVVANLLANCGLMYLLNIILEADIKLAKIIVETILFILSYFVQSRFIFIKDK